MKREILFRGKRTDNGEWVYGSLIDSDSIVGKIVDFDEEYFIPKFWYKVVPETVGQFTGMYDDTKWENASSFDKEYAYNLSKINGTKPKEEWKGKMIFEGDLVSFSSWKHGSHSDNPDFVFVYEIRFTRLSWYCCGDGFSLKLYQKMQDTPLNNDRCMATIIIVTGKQIGRAHV